MRKKYRNLEVFWSIFECFSAGNNVEDLYPSKGEV